MTDEEREIRYNVAVRELIEFCRLFGFGLKTVRYDRYDDGARSVLMTYPGNGLESIVMRVDPTRSYRRSYTKPYAVMEKMLAKLKNGAELRWSWSRTEPAEGGSVKTTRTRTYRLPKFSSVQELRILLMARGSEFAGGEETVA